MIVRNIGSFIRQDVPMVAKTYDELGDKKFILYNQLRSLYEFDDEDYNLFLWIDKEARKPYQQWKYEAKMGYFKHRKEELAKGNLDSDADTPEEFFGRRDQWDWLIDYWNSKDFKEKSEACVASRKENEHINRTGSSSIAKIANDFQISGKSLTPRADAALIAFPVNDPHSPNRERGRKFQKVRDDLLPERLAMQESMQESGGSLFDDPEVAAELDSQEIRAIGAQVGGPRGRVQAGVGRRVIIPTARDLGQFGRSFQSTERVEELVRTSVAEQAARLAQEREELRLVMEERLAEEKEAMKIEMNNQMAEERKKRHVLEGKFARLNDMFRQILQGNKEIVDPGTPE